MNNPPTPPTFFLIAGEASGDILGARLMRAMKVRMEGAVRFVGIGGPQMVAEGLELFFPHTELMHFGVVEVLRHIPRLLKLISSTAEEVLRVRPAALITIDSPDFCFRVAKKIKANDPAGAIPLIHYVAPTVWAWRAGRAKTIAQFLDYLLVVLPFEPPYFTREGLGCSFVGHSIVEGGAGHGDGAAFRRARGIAAETPLLTVLPGSRTGEITRLLPIFGEAVQLLLRRYPNLHVAVPTVPHLKERVATEVSRWGLPAHIVEGEADKYACFAASQAALACSGTVALELALATLPAVIAYKIHGLTALLYRRFIRVPYANLVNIMHDKMLVPEFLQENCTAEKLAAAIDVLLRDKTAREVQITGLAATAQWLGSGQFVPSERAAEVVAGVVKESAERSRDAAPCVLQVLPALVTGGVERGTVETAAALVRAGFRAIVASAGGPMVKEVEAVGGVHVTLPLAAKNPLVMVANIARLRGVIREQRVAVVHARSRAPAWSAYFAALLSKVPYVTTFHSAYGAGSWLKRRYNSVMAKGMRVIAISSFVAAYAEQTYGVARDILRVIPRGVDLAVFDRAKVTAARIEALRRAWGVSATTPVILLPGRLTRWKGQLVLVQALARMARRDFLAIIVGGGKDSAFGKEVSAAISEAKLGGCVKLVDTCRDMPAAYALAAMVVVPSTRPEGFGRVVIEAQAMGTPVIASDHGGAKETVIPGETGFLTTPGDAVELAQTIAGLLDMPEGLKEELAERSIDHIRAHFTTATMTDATLAVYREVIGGSKNS